MVFRITPDRLTASSRAVNIPLNVKFSDLKIGDFFEFHGRLYKKLALSMAQLQPDMTGAIFQYETEVQAKDAPAPQSAKNETT